MEKTALIKYLKPNAYALKGVLYIQFYSLLCHGFFLFPAQKKRKKESK